MELYDHQISALRKMKSGNILNGGVGSGKSRTALAYYYICILHGEMPVNGKGKYKDPDFNIPLYIITTARKRDTKEWELECAQFLLKTKVIIDSWNNIKKYEDAKNAFFIFDEQRVVGYGAWSKSFIKISKNNRWLLLSATPGDTWMDYIPVFIANGFYKNKTQFLKEHVIYSRYTKYPKVERYINTDKLEQYKNRITINMEFERNTISKKNFVLCEYDKDLYSKVNKERWNPYEEQPIKDAGEMCRVLRKIVNSDVSRLNAVLDIYEERQKVIIFYNFNFELNLLRDLLEKNKVPFSEWNGSKHEPIIEGNKWAYLVQYTAGAEGWNCILTDTIIFYSQNYSYKAMVQASGRINRLNTPYKYLYYYILISNSSIDKAISKALDSKKIFNEKDFMLELDSRKKHCL